MGFRVRVKVNPNPCERAARTEGETLSGNRRCIQLPHGSGQGMGGGEHTRPARICMHAAAATTAATTAAAAAEAL